MNECNTGITNLNPKSKNKTNENPDLCLQYMTRFTENESSHSKLSKYGLDEH